MALSIFEILETFGTINQNALAAAFVRRFTEEPHRGYAGGAVSLLMQMQQESLDVPGDRHQEAVERLGTGHKVTAHDTVPFCLWSAAYRLHDFEEAMWWTVRDGGDSDTTCAIVGGIVALSSGVVPADWLERREALPFPRSA